MIDPRKQLLLAAWQKFTSRLEFLAHDGIEPFDADYGYGKVKKRDNDFYIEWTGRAPTNDPFAKRMLTIGASLITSEFAINARIETWLKRLPHTPPRTDHIDRLRFVLGAYDSSLKCGTKNLTPSECADELWNFKR